MFQLIMTLLITDQSGERLNKKHNQKEHALIS